MAQQKCEQLLTPEKFSEIAQTIFKDTSLTPFDLAKPNPGMQRTLHGATHHARVAMWVRVIANLCKKHQLVGSKEELSDRNILLLQYVALFHDAARKDDYGEDMWEKESADMCHAFLVEHGISKEEALRFSSLIIKKEDGGSLLGKILQSADCLDIMRCRRAFHVDRMSIYSDFAQVEGAIDDYLIPLVKEAGKLIQAQSDMQNNVFVTLNNRKVISFKKSYNAEKPQLKEVYERAENCYARVTEDLQNFSWLKNTYTDSANVAPYNAYQEEEKRDEEDNIFYQEEILSYKLIVKDELPADANLVKGKIYLQKIGSKLNYVFKTPAGEVARYYIPGNVFPPEANLLQMPFTEEGERIILQWILENELGVYYQKAVRTDPYIYTDKIVEMLSGHKKYEEDEKQEENPEEEKEKEKDEDEEDKALNKILLRRAREEREGIHTVKRAEVFVSGFDETGKLGFYHTHEDRNGNGNGRSNGIKLAPHYKQAEKEGYSKPQSTSVISDKIPTQPVFEFDREGTPPVVILIPPDLALPHGYFEIYDGGGTARRPGDFYSYEDAKEYRDRKYKGENATIFTELWQLIEKLAAGKGIGKYNEALMRLRWVGYTFLFSQENEQRIPETGKVHFRIEEGKEKRLVYTLKSLSEEVIEASFEEADLKKMGITLDTLQVNFKSVEDKLLRALRIRGHIPKPCYLALPSRHTLSSRILTQHTAEQIKIHCGKKPRIVYMDDLPKMVDYTEAKQAEDREAAEKIAANPQALSEALEKNDFYFLLGLAPKTLREVLQHPQAKLIDFYTKGYVFFAKALAARAKINLKEIIHGVTWSNLDTVHPVAIEDLALNHPQHYIKLKSEVVNTRDGEDTPLDTALYFGRLKLAVALLAHKEIKSVYPREKRVQELFSTFISKGYKKIAQKLFATEGGPSAFIIVARKKAHKKGFGKIVEALASSELEIDSDVLHALFLLAVENGHATAVKALLTHRLVDPNFRDQKQYNQTMLIKATNKGHAATVQALLDDPRTDPNLQDSGENTALILAARLGRTDIVAALLGHPDTNPDIQDGNGDTALICAISRGHVDVVRVLLTHQHHKTDPNLPNKTGDTALMLAARLGRTDIVVELLAHLDIDPNPRNNFRSTALMMAVENGHTDIVKALFLHRKINFDLQEVLAPSNPQRDLHMFYTLFQLAVENGHAAAMKAWLIHRRIDPNFQEKRYNQTMLIKAAGNGHVAAVQALLDYPGTNPNLEDDDENTALIRAAQSGCTPIVTELLNQRNIKLNHQNRAGNTALILAALLGHTAAVKTLLDNNETDPNLRNELKKTALMLAVENGHIDIVKALLDNNKTKPNLQGDFQKTALMLAAENGHTAAVKALLDNNKPDPNLQDKFKRTALMLAVENGHIAAVKALLDNNKTDPNLRNNSGSTALMLAVENGHIDIVKALLLHRQIKLDLQNRSGKTAFALAQTEEMRVAYAAALVRSAEHWRKQLDAAQEANAADAIHENGIGDPYPNMTKFQERWLNQHQPREKCAGEISDIARKFSDAREQLNLNDGSKRDWKTRQTVASHLEALARIACDLLEEQNQNDAKPLTSEVFRNLQEAFNQRLYEGLLGKPPTSVKTWAVIGLAAGAIICGTAALVCSLSISTVTNFLLEAAQKFASLVDIPTDLAIGGLFSLIPTASGVVGIGIGAGIGAGVGTSFRFFEHRKMQKMEEAESELFKAIQQRPAIC